MFYCGVELLWRGWTHGSMFLLGAVCFYLVGSLDRRWHLPVLAQMLQKDGLSSSGGMQIGI